VSFIILLIVLKLLFVMKWIDLPLPQKFDSSFVNEKICSLEKRKSTKGNHKEKVHHILN
jgi:hypothetical protein